MAEGYICKSLDWADQLFYHLTNLNMTRLINLRTRSESSNKFSMHEWCKDNARVVPISLINKESPNLHILNLKGKTMNLARKPLYLWYLEIQNNGERRFGSGIKMKKFQTPFALTYLFSISLRHPKAQCVTTCNSRTGPHIKISRDVQPKCRDISKSSKW